MEPIAPVQKQSFWAKLRRAMQSPAVRIVEDRKAEDDRKAAALEASRVQADSSTASST